MKSICIQVRFATFKGNQFKTVLDSGFHAMDSGFFVSGTWILDSIVSGIPDSLSCAPYSRFHKQKSTRFRNLVRFPYMGR